jgi:hypothetical protein
MIKYMKAGSTEITVMTSYRGTSAAIAFTAANSKSHFEFNTGGLNRLSALVRQYLDGEDPARESIRIEDYSLHFTVGESGPDIITARVRGGKGEDGPYIIIDDLYSRYVLHATRDELEEFADVLVGLWQESEKAMAKENT